MEQSWGDESEISEGGKSSLAFRLALRQFAWRFLAFFVGASIFFRLFRLLNKEWNIPEGWPISEGRFLLPTLDGLIFVGAAIGLGILFFRHREWFLAKFPRVLAAAVGFAILTNGFHGVQDGFVRPLISTPEDGLEYYQDIDKVSTWPSFFRDYQAMQPDLGMHSRTHPPGPVLLMHGAASVFRTPAAISIGIGTLSLILLGFAFRHALTLLQFPEEKANLIAAALLFCAPVQIYTIYAVDATIAAVGCVLIAATLSQKWWMSWLGSAASLFILFLLSFGSMFFVIPVLAAGFYRKNFVVAAASVATAVLGILALKPVLGYSWLDSLMLASKLENPHGFRLLADPVSFVATRLENVFEPILFLGPHLMFLLIPAFRSALKSDAWEGKVMLSAIGTLTAIFLTGAYHTGETARAGLFLIPFLILGLGRMLSEKMEDDESRQVMIKWLLGYTFGFQLLMFFFW